ncbi:hypothetical protein U14_02118 [Candidatus Moduliflexus flocculans]|uniref:DUF5615 domain-containing protein n=1 Tax=Candidatus Moduliflexus flocculans TaxID=1499966 RepID=A0A0S6VTM5_9BACT|nr:hypothetical protein U14_02118 [Candidatus Moduliflexus flocculans]
MNTSEIKFLIDVGVGKEVENYIGQQGYDMKAIRLLDPGMPDEEIILLAYREERMVITMDKDFGELVYHGTKKHCGVLLLRLEDAAGTEKARVIASILQYHAAQLDSHFCVFQKGKLRIRIR